MNDATPSGPDVVVADVLQGLTDGRFVPGQRLVEPDLMRRYALGRSTVREALGRLAASGVVVQEPHRGAQIRLLTRRAAEDILRVTEPLLGLAARQAAEAVAAGADATTFVEAAEAYDGATKDHAAARAQYYHAFIALSGNAELERLLPMLQVHLIRAQLKHIRPPGRSARSDLVRTIAAGRANQAEIAARAQIRGLIDALPSVADTDFAAD